MKSMTALALIEQIGVTDVDGSPVSPAEVHGMVCADVVAPKPLPVAHLVALIIDQDHEQTGDLHGNTPLFDALTRLRGAIEIEIGSEEALALPFDTPALTAEDQQRAIDWALGFVSRQIEDGNDWFENDPDTIGELSLPIAALSGAIDEPPFDRINEDPELIPSLSSAISDAVIDLFLQMHAD